MVRIVIAGLLMALSFARPVQAIGDLTALLHVQEECAQVGMVAFGAEQRWRDCRVTKGRWASTIGLTDMYQVQYCLGGDASGCEQRAFQLFGNRAYTPLARLMIQRLDPPGTEYDDPLVVSNEHGHLLALSIRHPDGTRSADYYRWQDERWVPLDARRWLKDLARQLPAGVTAKDVSLPDIDSMSASAALYRNGGGACCSAAGEARMELGLRRNGFYLKKVAIGAGRD